MGEVPPEPLRLHLRLPPGQDIGEDLAEELEPLHQLVRPGALGPERAEREGPEERSAHFQRDLHLRRDPELPIRLPVHRRRLRRQLVDPREADHLTTLQPGHDPGDVGERHRGRSRRRSLGHPRVRDARHAGVVGELGQTAPVRPEEIGDPAKRPLDLAVDLGRRQAAERGRLLRQECLEAQPLGQQQLQALSLERPGEDLAEELQALHELVRPGALGPERVKDQHAEHGPADAQRKRQRRSDAQGLEALPIGRRLLGQLVDPGEPHDFSPLDPVGRPWELDRPRESGTFCRLPPPPRRCERWSRREHTR